MLYLPSLALSPAEVYNADNLIRERDDYAVDVGIAALERAGYL